MDAGIQLLRHRGKKAPELLFVLSHAKPAVRPDMRSAAVHELIAPLLLDDSCPDHLNTLQLLINLYIACSCLST
jgi:hypothetical protein